MRKITQLMLLVLVNLLSITNINAQNPPTNNVVFGYGTGTNSTGGNNVFMGVNAGNANTSGVGNTFLGTQSGLLSVTGNANVFLGNQAGLGSTGGYGNTFIGSQAGYGCIESSGNTAIGNLSAVHLKNGNNNIFLGKYSGVNFVNGNNNVFIGSNTSPNISVTSNDQLNIADKIYGKGFGNDIAIGIGVPNPNNTLEIKSAISNNSGLRFTNLNSSSPFAANTTNRSLSLNPTGDVVLSNTINSISNQINGNQLTTTINGINSLPITLPLASSENIYNVNGRLSSERTVDLNVKRLIFFDETNLCRVVINPTRETGENGSGNLSLFTVDDFNSTRIGVPNLYAKGILNLRAVLPDYGRRGNLTTGGALGGFWTQANFGDGSFKYHINPLGGNVGIGVADATAQLHTKNSVRFENLANMTNPTSILGTDSNGNVFNYNPSLLSPATTNNLATSGNTITSNVNNVSSSTPIINTVNTAITGNQLTTTINGVSSTPIALPEQHLEPMAIDGYLGTRLKPTNPSINGFNINKNTNSLIGYTAFNTNTTGNIAAVSIGAGINGSDNYKDVTYLCHFGPSYYISKFAGNGGLFSDKELFIGTYGANKSIDFFTGDTFNSTQSRFKIQSDNISSASYPNTRNDSPVNRPANFLYTDENGKFLSAPLSAIVSPSNENIYTVDGSLNNPRTLSLNEQTLTFQGSAFNQIYNSNVSINNCSIGTSGESFSTINGYHKAFTPDFNRGFFKIKNTNYRKIGESGSQLNFGVGMDNTWLQSSSFSRTGTKFSNCTNTSNALYLNPLGGKVAIGTTNINQDTACPDCDNYRLFVAQGIRTEKVRVDIASIKGWADYVFAIDYKLMPLKELDYYIKTNGHLPNIPNAEEVVKKGIDLGEMNAKLLEKVEELTLHTIDLNTKNESQQKVIDDLISRLEKLEKNNKK